MPALNPAPPRNLAPVQTRRRVWAHPELRSHSLVVLTPEHLYLAPLVGRPKPGTIAAIEAGADLDTVLGPLATVIDLAAVRRARLDLLANSLVLEYAAGGGTAQLVVVFATPSSADACFTKVWRRLGDGFELLPYKQDWWSLARAPLCLLGVILAVTAALALGLHLSEGLSAPRAAATVNVSGAGDPGAGVRVSKDTLNAPGWLDWRIVCGLGGAAAAAAQVWLYRRLTQPPDSLELART